MAFADGYELYNLNGVQMPKDYVLTPSEKLDANLILSEKNVEVRRELLRKIGVERFIQVAGAKELDALKVPRLNTEYTLLSVRMSGEVPEARYLKMLNPSIGVWHVEAVGQNCNTVLEAIHSRKPKLMREIPVGDDGEDWYQQGDVCVWGKNATKLKPLPALLT